MRYTNHILYLCKMGVLHYNCMCEFCRWAGLALFCCVVLGGWAEYCRDCNTAQRMALQVGVRRSCSMVLRCLPNIANGCPVLSLAGGVVKLPVAMLHATFGEKYPYEKPFPYEEWPKHSFAFSQDYTEWRFNENTKVIIIIIIIIIEHLYSALSFRRNL